jgi:solute carrier family 35 protein
MNFVNRWSLLLYPLPAVVLLLQMVATLAILQPLMWGGVLTFQPFRWCRCRQLLGISVLYTGNTAFALYGLKTLNVPMYSTLKRLTPMIVLLTKVGGKSGWAVRLVPPPLPPPFPTTSMTLM